MATPAWQREWAAPINLSAFAGYTQLLLAGKRKRRRQAPAFYSSIPKDAPRPILYSNR